MGTLVGVELSDLETDERDVLHRRLTLPVRLGGMAVGFYAMIQPAAVVSSSANALKTWLGRGIDDDPFITV